MTFNFVDSDEAELVFTVGLTAIDADGTAAKPLPAVIGSQYVISLAADATVYITNDTINARGAAALDVSGTNFKASYGEYNYSKSFMIDAPYYDATNKLVPQTIEVGTADGAEGIVTLYFNEHTPAGSEEDPIILELDQTVTHSTTMFDGYHVEFTAATAGTYKFTFSEDTFVSDPSYVYLDGDDMYTEFELELTAGAKVHLVLCTFEADSGDRSVTVTQVA